MKSSNLNELATLILKLTWSEMHEIVGSDGFCSSYSSAEPKKIISWAERQLLADKEVTQ